MFGHAIDFHAVLPLMRGEEAADADRALHVGSAH